MNQHTTNDFLIFNVIKFKVVFLLFELFQNIEVLFHISIQNIGNDKFAHFGSLLGRQKLQEVALLSLEKFKSHWYVVILEWLNFIEKILSCH